MTALAAFARAVDALNDHLGRITAWLLAPMALVAFSVVVLRYAFEVGYPWLSETFVWLNGAIVMLSAAYVLKEDKHVRVDLFYRTLGPRGRAWIDLVGVWLLLMPMVGTLAWLSWPIVQRSWRIAERSPTPDGLTFLYLVKATVIAFCVLTALQGLAISIRCLMTLSGRAAPRND
ncbi:MAG: TRAP transporter small permease subunit [Pseudomonadota bacterium]